MTQHAISDKSARRAAILAALMESDSTEAPAVSGAIGTTGALRYVKRAEDQSKGAYALVSDKDGKPLRYFDHEPSEAEAAKALGEIEAFKHS